MFITDILFLEDISSQKIPRLKVDIFIFMLWERVNEITPIREYAHFPKVNPLTSFNTSTSSKTLHWRYLFPATNHNHLNVDETNQNLIHLLLIGLLIIYQISYSEGGKCNSLPPIKKKRSGEEGIGGGWVGGGGDSDYVDKCSIISKTGRVEINCSNSYNVNNSSIHSIITTNQTSYYSWNTPRSSILGTNNY